MNQIELDNWVIKENLKFDYTFTTLIFATLGLSIQFSPGMGKECPWMLIFSWIFLLVSAFAGGYQLKKLQYFYQVDATTSNYVIGGNAPGVKRGRELLDKERKVLKFLIFVRQWGYLIGITLNVAFATINYLHKALS